MLRFPSGGMWHTCGPLGEFKEDIGEHGINGGHHGTRLGGSTSRAGETQERSKGRATVRKGLRNTCSKL